MPETPQEPDKPEVKTTNYQDRSKAKQEQSEEKKVIEKVVVGEVVVQKKKFGRKAKEAVVAADFKSVGGYLFWDVLIPAVKTMIVDTATKGIERAIYGDRAIRTRNNVTRDSRMTIYPYNQHSNPLNQSSSVIDMTRRSIDRTGGSRETYILYSRDDADRVLDQMTEIIQTQGFATVATMKELMGLDFSPQDYKWGWKTLVGVRSHQVQQGWVIDFPAPVPV